ncbi:nuclease-related domain-containing protein [Celeribacter sp. ULVN23_4]
MEVAVVVIVSVIFVTIVAYLKSPSVRGALGEARVNASLQSHLGDVQYRMLKDVTLPTSRGTTQIDHIVLLRSGVFVVETKNMSGWIFGAAGQARWTQVLPKFKKQFQNPLRQNYGHVKVVQALLEIPSEHVYNVVVFVGDAKPKSPMPPNVLWGASGLSDYIKMRRNPVFSESDLHRFEERLKSRALEATRRTRREHVRSVKTHVAGKAIDKSKCPLCGAKMVERTNRKTGETFRGCSRYPKCRGSRKN